MKLSVVIPVYNGAEFILKSYHSILSQDIDDFELLYVDNNSADNSIEIIKKLQLEDQRVILLDQTKQGASAARNKGIASAKGDYVYIFDVDDEIYPGALQKMITVLDASPSLDAVFGKMVKSQKSILKTVKPDNETHEVIIKEKPFWGLYWFSSLANVVGPPAFLYRKDVFKSIGLYNESLLIGEDTAFDIKLGMLCNVAFLDMYIYLYFRHVSSTNQSAKINNEMVFHTWKRFTLEHLPFYFNHKVPREYTKILFLELYRMMGKIICRTQGFTNRKIRLQNLKAEVSPLKLPFLIHTYLVILVFLPMTILLKFYVYYLSDWYSDKHLKNEVKLNDHEATF
ncbi:glycosyltransferase family 2 protein [Hanstruepera ponticola]|uniref:glycosyltransferase family 2 protein n=1 Tax=Hanstruepera ponticola TaxID=2042995 RepID=UPI0017829154|nr:glycosyltransferase [Hanstruepera ponticola]